ITYTDGNSFYGPVVKLRENNPTTLSFSIKENPVKNVLVVSFGNSSLKNTFARIVNAQGLTVQKITIKNEMEYINVSSLGAGTYIFQTVEGSSRFVIVR
ncbi:MAG TPA: T9SS type A sorting domain-containing protein, partial [Ferruginibacter sp.]|nr:T9SS type A sorting domain-containing protein [Ferruginibacter sp.]